MEPKPETGAGPSPLAQLLGRGTRALKVIEFPGERGLAADGSRVAVGVWNLLDAETRAARMAAVQYLSETLKMSETHLIQLPEIGDEEAKVQMLWRALRDPHAPLRPFAKDPAELRWMLTPDERETLFAMYLEFVDERSPLRKLQSAAEVEAFVEALKKGSTRETLLSCYDGPSLRSAVRCMAAHLSTSTRASSSGSSLATALQSSPSDSSPASAE